MSTSSVTRHGLGPFEVGAALEFGPRIVSLRLKDGPEQLAVLDPDIGLPTPSGELFRFRGGHRLWAAPEVPQVTYSPDDRPCDVTLEEDHLRITGSEDAVGFTKEIEVIAGPQELTVEHRLLWNGEQPIKASPWAITQLALGGLAIMPLVAETSDRPEQADRSLVLWPYTRIDDERLGWTGRAVTIDAGGGPPIKVGAGPSPGLLGYLRDGLLFTKTVASADGGEFPDRGAVGQVFVNDDFCELESLGPLAWLEPGESAEHREVWRVTACPDLSSAVRHVIEGAAG